MIQVIIEMDDISSKRSEQDAFLAEVCRKIKELSMGKIKDVKVVKVQPA